MTEIMRHTPQQMTAWQPEVPKIEQGVRSLVEWAQEADAAYQLAQRICATPFAPDAFRGKPDAAAAAMLAGGEIGLSPLTALGAFDVIQGRAAARAITLRAVVQAAGHEIILVESTETRCKMKGRRAGGTEWQQVTWTIDRAKQLGLTGKDNWKKQPGAMFVARATSELARLIASDAILGIGGGISAEEISDGSTVEMTVEPAEDKPRVVRRKKAAEKQPEPEQEPPAEVEPETDEPGPSEAQRKKMFAVLGESGYSTREDYLHACSEVIGRQIESSNDLTAAEISRVIDHYDGPVQEEIQ